MLEEKPENTETAPTFPDIAKEVIRSSIRSAVCIDDEYLAPYSDTTEGLIEDEPKKLYYSFREDGHCDLDIYQFENLEKSWGKKHMILNKDLMILDWELDPGGGHESALTILKDVVSSNGIPFVLIYTNTPNLIAICKSITSQFNPNDKNSCKEVVDEIGKQFSYFTKDKDAMDVESTLEEMKSQSFDYIHQYTERKEIEGKLLEEFIKGINIKEERVAETPEKLKKIISNKISNSEGNELLNLCHLIQCNGEDFETQPISRVFTKTPAYNINGTTVMVFHKKGKDGGIEPDKLFSEFSKILINDPHNFLSILSLEFKDNLRKHFGMVGLEFSQINELAFFYHMNNYRNEAKEFDYRHIYDFVLNTWISELHHQKMNEESKLLPFLGEFFDKIKDKLTLDDNLLQELAKYCLFVSNVNIINREDKALRFGDTFSCEGQKELFFLSITPHCDLINPKDKINNNFYFIKGVLQHDLKIALKDVDREFYSFADMEGMVVAIKWICKPFTFYLEKNEIDSINISYSSKQYKLKHIAIVKENFTQRIANQSFGYGHRVGIDIPYIAKE